MIKKFKDMYETKAIYIIGFLLSYPIVLIAANSLPINLAIEKIFYLSVLIWTMIFLIKPIKNIISTILLVVQMLWSFSLISLLPVHLKLGLENAFASSTTWAAYIYDKLFGEEYLMLINWIRNFILRKEQHFNEFYYYVFVIFIIASIMIIVMQLLEKRVNWKVFLAVSIYFVVGWFLYVSGIKGYFSLYFVGLTVYRQYLIYDNQVKEAKSKGERTRYYNFSSAIIVGSVLMVIILLISNIAFSFFPVEEMNVKVNQIIPRTGLFRSDYKVIKGSRIFNFSSTMYSPNKDVLGGPIVDRDYSVIMRLKANDGAMYLRGRSKNVYDGTKWTSSFDTYKNNIKLSEDVIPDGHVDEIVIYPEILVSRTIFSPYKYYISSFQKVKVFGNEDSIVYRKQKTNTGLERYSVKYVKPEYIGLYDELDEKIRDEYLSIPSDLTKTKGLTERITQGIVLPYDKMKALERYLRENYRYTLNTEEVDTNKDFVESFLFEEKRGYCTYFATSLAIMGRFVDIPTRYVEGFITSDFVDYEGYYEVSANRAHAWVEAYIEGEGWVRFEATPAYLNGDEIQEKEEFEDSLDSVDGITGEFNEDRFNAKEEDLEVQDIDGNQMSSIEPNDVLVILIYGLLIIGVVLLVLAKMKRLKGDISKGNNSEKVKKRIMYILSMISLFDQEQNTSELPTHVILRNSKDYLEYDVPEEVVGYVNLSLYSMYSFSEEEFNFFDEFFNEYEERVKKHISPLTHFVSKIIFNTLYHKDYYKD